MNSVISLRLIGTFITLGLIWSCAGRVYLPTTWFIPPSAHNDNSPKASFRNEIYGGIIGAQYEGETGFMVGIQSGVHTTGELFRGGIWMSAWYGQYFYTAQGSGWRQVPGAQIQGLFSISPTIYEDNGKIKRLEIGLWTGLGVEGVEDFRSIYDPITHQSVVQREFYFMPVPTGGLVIGYQAVNTENLSFMFRYYLGLGGGIALSFRHKAKFEIGLSTQILAFTIRPDMPPARLSLSWWIN